MISNSICFLVGLLFGWLFLGSKGHKHNFSMWKEIGKGKITADGRIIGSYVTQSRTCKDCGRVELQEAKSSIL